MKYPVDMDKECIPLCDAINGLKGLKTTESCCGHGKSRFRVYVTLVSGKFRDLLPLLYYLDECHSGVNGWQCVVYSDCNYGGPYLMVHGPKGDYKGANKIAKCIQRAKG